MKNKIYPAVIEKDGNGYMVSFPDLPGCFTQGDTVEEAFEYAKEALGLYLEGATKMPKASSVFDIANPDGGVVMLVEAGDTETVTAYKANELPKIMENAFKKSGFTKYKVAQIMGLSESYINRIASGERTPSPDVAKRIALLLNIDWQAFYGEPQRAQMG